MKISLSTATIVTGLALSFASASAQAVWGMECLRSLVGLSNEPQSVLYGLSEAGRHRLETFIPGDEVTLAVKGKETSGWLHEVNFDGVLLEADGKLVLVPHKRVDAMNLVYRPTEPIAMSETLAPKLEYFLSARTERMEYLKSLDLELKIWNEISAPLVAEVRELRRLKSAAKTQAIVDIGQAIIKKIEAKYHTSRLGFHYNLHGGQARDYVAGGIRASSTADIATHYDPRAPRRLQTYFFNSGDHTLYEILSARHPQNFFMRMGFVMIVFPLDSHYFKTAQAEGGILDSQAIYLHFNGNWLNAYAKAKGLPYSVGIPSSEFLTPPLSVFDGTGRKLQAPISLGREEETLAHMRFLEAVLGAN